MQERRIRTKYKQEIFLIYSLRPPSCAIIKAIFKTIYVIEESREDAEI